MARKAPNPAANGLSGQPAEPALAPPANQEPAAPKVRNVEMAGEKVGMDRIKKVLTQYEPMIQSLIPKYASLNAKRLISTAMIACGRNHELKLCKPSSVLYTTLAAARLGLPFSSDQAVMRPNARYGRKPDGKIDKDRVEFHYASLILAYQGMVTIASRNGYEITAQWITYDDINEGRFVPDFVHYDRTVFKPDLSKARIGDNIVWGAVAFFRRVSNGRVVHMEVMSDLDIDRVRVDDKFSDAWADWPEMMIRKSPIRRGFNMIPKDTEELAMAIELSDRGDRGEPLDEVIEAMGLSLDPDKIDKD